MYYTATVGNISVRLLNRYFSFSFFNGGDYGRITWRKGGGEGGKVQEVVVGGGGGGTHDRVCNVFVCLLFFVYIIFSLFFAYSVV